MFCTIIITLILPPLGVFKVTGCGADLFINICLTLLGYFPGHVHAFYLEYQFYNRRKQAAKGLDLKKQAPFIYSRKVQTGGKVQTGDMV